MQEQGALPSPFERDFNDLRQPRGGQVRNDAGCYTNQINDLKRLERFIVVGAEQGYRATEGSLTRAKLQCLKRLIRYGRGPEGVALIEKISRQRRNLRQKPLLFAFALCARAADSPTSKSAYRCFLNVCRTPTHLFLFVKFCEEFSERGTGWGRAHKRVIQRWYLQFKNDPLRLFRLVTKYKKREGWTHKDVLRLAHPKPPTNALAFIFSYITEQPYEPITNTEVDDGQINWMKQYEEARKMEREEDMRFLIQEFGFSWQHIPTRMLNSSLIWQALLKDMPVEAFLRHLGRMTRLEMFRENSEEEKIATSKIGSMNISATSDTGSTATADDDDYDDDEEEGFTRRNNIIHPFRIFVALQNYQAGGRSGRGRLTWIPSTTIIRALENAFDRAIKCSEPINKKCLIAVDVSFSMEQPVLRTSNITCTMAAAAMMMSLTPTQSIQPNQPDTIVGGFSNDFTEVQKDSLTTLEGAMRTMSECRSGGGPSDCSSPIKWAIENRINDIDAFIIFTANINSCGNMHPAEAVRQYRQYAGSDRIKLVVVGLLDNDFSIADQLDWDMIDVAGFDLALPHVVAEFVGNND